MPKTPIVLSDRVIEIVPLDSLILDPTNARGHGDASVEGLKGSLTTFGEQELILVREDNVVTAGNGRVLAARALKWKTIEIVRTKLTGAMATAYSIASNHTAELSVWIDPVLAKHLEALRDEGFPVESTGFSQAEIDALITKVKEEAEAADKPKDAEDKGSGLAKIREVVIAEPKTVVAAGDIFKLGRHTLLCVDLLEDWPLYVPHLTPGSKFMPYPSPLLPLADAEVDFIMVQPDLYLCAMTCDLWEAASGQKVARWPF